MTEENEAAPSFDKTAFVLKCDAATTEVETLIAEVENATGSVRCAMLQSLSVLAEKGDEKLLPRLYALVQSTVRSTELTRADRKAALAVLEVAPLPVGNQDIRMILEALEEPQMHIVIPELSRLTKIVEAVDQKRIPFSWVDTVLARTLSHTNGWIRCWAVEAAVGMKVELLVDNYGLIIDTVLPSLNASDLLWRLLDQEKLESFYSKLQCFFDRMADVAESDFFVRLLHCLSSLTCPVSLFLLSRILTKAPLPLLRPENYDLIRSCLIRAATCNHLFLRLQTFGNLATLFARHFTADDREELISCFASLSRIVGIPHRYQLISDIATVLCHSEHCRDALNDCDTVEKLNEGSNVRQVEEWLLSAMISMKKQGGVRDLTLKDQLKSGNVPLQIATLWANFNPEVPPAEIIEALLQRTDLHKITEHFRESVRNVNVSEEDLDKWFEQLHRETNASSVCLRLILLSSLVIVSPSSCTQQTLNKFTYNFALETPLPDLPSSCDLPRTEKALLKERAEAARLAILNQTDSQSKLPVVEAAEYAVKSVYEASLYDRKEQLLRFLIGKIPALIKDEERNSDLLIRIVRAAEDVVNEEKKSAKFLPSVRLLLSICTQLLLGEALLDEVISVYNGLLEAATLNVSISILMAKSLHDALPSMRDSTLPMICDILTALAVFGPIPKKEVLVLYRALEFLNDSSADEETRIHEAVHRCRLYAIAAALQASKRSQDATKALVQGVIEQVAEADKSTSKSFGLSLAHRRKTRAVALLLLLSTSNIPTQSLCPLLFSSCVSWLTDPSQQFSIKLAVEWLVVLLAVENETILDEVLTMDKKMASQRIGSVSSWLNIMSLLSRALGPEILLTRILPAVLPWCTAQNFAVRCTAIAVSRLILQPEGLRNAESGTAASIQSIVSIGTKVAYFDAEPAGNSQRVVGSLVADFFFAHVRPIDDLSMQAVLEVLPRGTGLPPDEIITLSLMESMGESLSLPVKRECRAELRDAESNVYKSLEKNNHCAPSLDCGQNEDGAAGDTEEVPSSSTQKKIIPKEETRNENKSLFVVASLIDKPANLGGLCRTCEIFTVDRLVVADKLITQDSTFRALSMSAENWQKFEEVRPDELRDWVASMKRKRYAIVAAEQASDSVPLHRYAFPEKCVLIMGDEKRGVPMALLRAVDHIVHVEQLGKVRSLNVHVTAALFIERYAEQHLVQE